jgi:hypothetical protein
MTYHSRLESDRGPAAAQPKRVSGAAVLFGEAFKPT